MEKIKKQLEEGRVALANVAAKPGNIGPQTIKALGSSLAAGESLLAEVESLASRVAALEEKQPSA